VNKACREIEIPSQDGDEFGRRSGLADVCEEGKPWWHTQLQTQLSHAKMEVMSRPPPSAGKVAEEEAGSTVKSAGAILFLKKIAGCWANRHAHFRSSRRRDWNECGEGGWP
jgi:hypothetical protein